MNILFLTLSSIEDIKEKGIYTDIIRELDKNNLKVYVVTPRERRTGLPTELSVTGNINILKVATNNITETNSFIKKGLATINLEKEYLRVIKKYFSNVNFNMVMYSTPPINFVSIIKYFKKKHKSKTYLILKDIFPQNAVDLGIMKNGGFIWRYFKKKEKLLYRISDKIGCMSMGNKQYILKYNKEINREKVEIFPNSIEMNNKPFKNVNKKKLLSKYNIRKDSVIFIYGGNLGKPQGIDFLLDVIDSFGMLQKTHLLIIGSGTEYEKIKQHINKNKPDNVNLYQRIPKNKFDDILSVSNVGLIFLDRRFTIPNFPSRLVSYMEFSLPILAATDSKTDLKNVLKESGSGFWVESGDIKSFFKYAKILSKNAELRKEMGLKGRKYLKDNYDIEKNIKCIIEFLREKKIDYVQR
jgi:glycosyltransferase involved in cell wall biosynthesis